MLEAHEIPHPQDCQNNEAFSVNILTADQNENDFYHKYFYYEVLKLFDRDMVKKYKSRMIHTFSTNIIPAMVVLCKMA